MFQRRRRAQWFQHALLFLPLSLLLAAAGCGGGSAAVTTAQKTLTSIAVSSANAAGIAVGATEQLTATATYSDGSTANVTTTAAWTSATASIATVSAAGVATGVASGTSIVTATLSGVSGTMSVAVTAAPAATLTSIAVTPATGSVLVGATQQFTATATYSNSTTANVTATATWATASATVATVNAAGLATGVAVGTTSVTATLSGVAGTATLSVTAPPVTVTSIAVTPLAGSVAVGATQQFTATATYSNSTTANVTATATWTTASGAIATVNAAGLATGIAVGSTTVTATLSGISASATLSITAQTLASIAVTPNPASMAMGATLQFTATATYSDNTTADVTSTVSWTAANTSVATIDASTGLAMGVASGSTTITATLNAITGSAPLTVTIAAGTGVNIPTWHADTNRSGLNAAELSLTPSNVSAATFGKLFSYVVDGYVYGEPLLMSNLTVAGATHNVLYVATENDSVYAFDADTYGTGAPLWQLSLLQTGETALTKGAILPNQGVTSTPVIDPTTNTMYVVSAETSGGVGTFRLNALNILTGAQQPGSPVNITASVAGINSSGNGSTVTLTTACVQRAALLLANGNVYIGIGGCPTGWLLAYTALTSTSTAMTQIAVFNSSPNLEGEGAYASAGGIWMGGGGPAADSAGNIYVSTGNGPWDGMTAWGDSVLKFTPQLGVTSTNAIATPTDYFTPDDFAYMNCNDSDLASGGLLLIPGTAPNASEALAGGKTGELYLVNTASLGHESATDAGVSQELFFESDVVSPYTNTCTDTIDYPYDTSGLTHTASVNSYSNYGTAAYFNGSVYLGVTPTLPNVAAGVRQFTYTPGTTGGTLAIAGAYPADYTTLSIQEGSYGTTPFISANGTTNGIVWMIDHGEPLQNADSATPSSAILRAYNATDLTTQLYSSSTNTADTPGYGIKFTSPIEANGKVYISTGHALTTATAPLGEIDVYGLH